MNPERKKRIGGTDLSALVYGKVPPQSKEMEVNVLGAILIESRCIYLIVEYLDPEVFYVHAHQLIYEAILALHNASEGIDLGTVVEKLRSMEKLESVGGAYFVAQLTNSISSSAHIEQHCRIIIQKYVNRKLIQISGETIQNAYDDTSKDKIVRH
jgi:replicative DNA helicase